MTPVVRIRDDGGKVVKSFTAKPTGKTGVYHAVVRFPGSGTFAYEVYDGFVTYGGAQTHTFKPVQIGAPADSFPYLPLGIAAALALALAAATTRRLAPPDAGAGHGHEPEGGRMTKLFVLVATVVAGLALAGVAQAGCMATVGLDSMPKAGHPAGKPWVVTIRVLQHGRTPMPDAKPEVRIRNAAGKLFVFKATKTARSRVVPRPGRLPEGRPLLARRLRRLPGQGVREGAHLQVRADRRGLRLCCGAGLPAGAAALVPSTIR